MTKVDIAKELGIGVPTLYAATRTTSGPGGGKGKPATVARGRGTKKEERRIELSAVGDPIQAGIEQALANAKTALRAFGREVESLLQSRAGDTLRVALKSNGYPLVMSEREVMRPMGESGGPPERIVKVETWPVVASLTAAISDVQARMIGGLDR